MLKRQERIKNTKKTKKKFKYFYYIVLPILALLIGIGSYWGITILNFANEISVPSGQPNNGEANNQTKPEDETPKWDGEERVNILVIGSDSRDGANEKSRTDSMMILSVDPKTKKVFLFSVLRDTWVKIPDHGSNRVNAAYSFGGPELTMKTISDLLGIPIQYYVDTDFNGFISLVDVVGGVEIDVEKNMKYKSKADKHEFDIDLKKGLQVLNGEQALQYVRFRSDSQSDFGRAERQRKFIGELAKKLQKTSSLLKIPSILNEMAPFIKTNLTPKQMLQLAALGFEVNTSEIVQQQLPPQHLLRDERINGAEVLATDEVKLKEFMVELFTPQPDPITEGGTDPALNPTNTDTSNP